MATITSQNQWVEALSPGTITGTDIAVVSPDSGIAQTNASRTSDAPASGSMGCQGGCDIAVNNCSTEPMTSYSRYIEAWALAGKHPEGDTQGLEIAVINQTGTTAPEVDPYNQDPPGLIEGNRIGVGKPGQNGNVISACLQFVNVEGTATAKAIAGIVFGAASLLGGFAIKLAQGHRFQWYSAANTPTSYIRCDGTTSANALAVIFNENGVYIQNAKGVNTHAFTQDTNGNGHIQVMQNGSWRTVI